MYSAIQIGHHFLGPNIDDVNTYPEPSIGWATRMADAVGVEGIVDDIDYDHPSHVHLHFPSLNIGWWYTIGALTLRGESLIEPKYHLVIIEGKSIFITTPVLENLKYTLGIPV